MSSPETPDFTIEELAEADLPQAVTLLCEGFPMRSRDYWEEGLARLGARSRPPSTEKYGYGLVSEGVLGGVVLTIPSIHDGPDGPMVLVNISSWYARPAFRGPPAKALYRHATRRDDVSYTNLSAAPHTIKTITGFGFHEWSAGQVVALSWRNDRSSPVSGRVLTQSQAEAIGLAPADAQMLADHDALGCLTLVLETNDGLCPLVFVRRRIKGLIPCAQLIYCRDLAEVTDNGARVWAALARRGFPLLLVDASGPVPGLAGRYVAAKSSKYVKGPQPLNAVDHLYSEMVLLGF